MDEISILPADSYIVINKTILQTNDTKILTMLYQPIIGTSAINLYLTLCQDLDKNEFMSLENSHHHLMTNMRMRLEDIIVSREKLEAVGLLKSYYKEAEDINSYIYEIFSPISASDFFNHPILNIVLYNNVGKKEYERIVSYFKAPRISLSEYKDITRSFNEVFESTPGTMFENALNDIKKVHRIDLNVEDTFDFSLLESLLPSGLLSRKSFTKDEKKLIQNLSYIYNLDTTEIKNIIMNSINEKRNIDKTLLRKNARNYYQFENNGKLPSLIYQKQPEYLRNPVGNESKRAKMIYIFETVSPYNFLKNKYNGAKPTTRDLNLIENLMVDVGLKPAVVNVLIDYVMRVNDKKISKNFVETIAGQWKRLNIETAEDAMNQAEKETKKQKVASQNKTIKYKKEETKVPKWFDKKIEKETISKEEENEVKDMLKEFV